MSRLCLRLRGMLVALVVAAGMATVGLAGAEPAGLVDQHGQPVTEAAFGPEFRLVYFGYTHCPDACPLALQVMADAIDGLGRLGERITPVFVSLDPERDTTELLKSYAETFHARMLAVGGNASAIADLAKRYGVTYAKSPGGSPDAYTIDHSTMIYLTDAQGRIVGRFTQSIAPRALGARIVERMMQAQ